MGRVRRDEGKLAVLHNGSLVKKMKKKILQSFSLSTKPNSIVHDLEIFLYIS